MSGRVTTSDRKRREGGREGEWAMRVVKASGGFIGSRRRPCHFVFVTSRVVQANIAVSDDGEKRLCTA